MWVHPTRGTVGSALRMIGEQMASSGGHVDALAIVPSPPAAAWAGLLRHGTVVGELAAGSGELEEHRPGGWRTLITHQPSLIVGFPRAAGAFAYPLMTADRDWSKGEVGYGKASTGAFYLYIPFGGYVYTRSKLEGSPGSLCRVVEAFSRASGNTARLKELLRLPSRHKVSEQAKRAAYEVPPRAKVWEMDGADLYTVNHLVKPLGENSTGLTAYVDFDWQRAEHEIAVVEARRAAVRPEWVLVDASSEASFTDQDVASLTSFDAERELEAAQAQLADLNLRAAQATRGREGVIEPGSGKQVAAPNAHSDKRIVQLCQYAGMTCGGCGADVRIGEPLTSVVDCLVHQRAGCIAAAVVRVEAAVVEGKGSSKGPPEFYVVSTGSATGVFTDLKAARKAAGGLGGVKIAKTAAEAREILGGQGGYGRAQANATFADMEEPVAAQVPGGIDPGSIQRRAQLAEKLSEPRLAKIMRCIEGKCGVTTEQRTGCLGVCGRSLHMMTCGQVGKGYAALGNFTCPTCRGEKLVAEGAPTASVVKRAAQTMILEMTQGAEATAGGYADFIRLAEEYASGSGMKESGGRLIMPQDGLEACKNFVTWLVMDDDRALSLEQTLRGGEAYVTKTAPEGTANVFKHPALKAHVKTFASATGKDRTPKTAATPRMMSVLTSEVIPARWPTLNVAGGRKALHEYMRNRWALEILTEAVGGARIGEAVGGGDFHGLMANHVCVIRHPDCKEKWNREVVEFKLEHSKTGHARYLNVAGTTQISELKVAEALRGFWQASGLNTVTEQQAGAEVTRADYWVVRVSLLGVDEADLESLGELLSSATDSEIVKHAKATMTYARERHKAFGVGSQAKKYVNVTGGQATSVSIAAAVDLLKKNGWAKYASVVPGPLIRATSGFLITHMPLSTASTFDTTKKLLTSSCEVANRDSPDPHLDLQGRTVPVWTTHSLRRLSDTNARRFMKDTRFGRKPVEPWEINLLYGWNEAEMEKDMQMHYATMGLWERIQQARITCMI